MIGQEMERYLLEEPSKLKTFTKNFIRYLWFDTNQENAKDFETINRIKRSVACDSMEQLIETVKSDKHSVFRIITSSVLAQDVCREFQHVDQVTHIYVLCISMETGSAIRKKCQKVAVVTNSVQDFIEKIKQQVEKQSHLRMLPHFILTSQQSFLRYNQFGLLLMKNKIKAKEDLIKLAEHFYPQQKQSNIVVFQNQYPLELNPELTLRWYTKDSFFVKIINNLLLFSQNPLELSYIRLPFNDLFLSIKKMYKPNLSQDFQVYRGGKIISQGIQFLKENVGKCIEMLGFLSANRQKSKAQEEANNLMLIIKVGKEKKDEEIDYGYIDISDQVNHKDTLLFNALNIFLIEKIETVNNFSNVTLRYGSLAAILSLQQNNQKLTKTQLDQIQLYKDNKKARSGILTQGDVLYKCQMLDQYIRFNSQMIQKNYDKQQKELVKLHFETGKAYYLKGNLDKALQSYLNGSEIQKKLKGQDISVASAYHNIGKIYLAKNKLDQALSFQSESLRISIKCSGDQNKQVGIIYKSIGKINKLQGDNFKALKNYLLCLKIEIKNAGYMNYHTANTYFRIGQLYALLREFDKAETYFVKCLEINISTLGQVHQLVIDCYIALAKVQDQKGEFQKAIENYEAGVNIQIKIHGDNHRLVLQSYDQIAQLYKKCNNLQKTMEYYKKILTAQNGNEIECAKVYSKFGSAYKKFGQINNALQNCHKSLKIFLENEGEGKNVSKISNELGGLWFLKGDYDKSLQFFLKSLQINKNTKSQETTMEICSNIGQIYQKKEDWKQALLYYEGGLKINIEKYDKQSLQVADLYLKIGRMYQKLNKIKRCLQNFCQAYKIRIKVLGVQDQLSKELYTEMTKLARRKTKTTTE